jgi:hypothetical protein
MNGEALSVMLNETERINKEVATAVIQRKIDARLIKQRDAGGGKKLDYIAGSTVIRLLNEAFNYQWSFEIVEEVLVQSLPKFNKWAKKGEDPWEPQQPYIKVLGRLSVPGYGIKEQYGTKILLGGASEQEGAAKSAATDALKKCATLLGIGLELYEDELVDEEENTEAPAQPAQTTKQQTAPKKTASTEADGGQWDDESIDRLQNDIDKLKDFREKLGIKDENFDDLNPFVQDFLNNPKATYRAIGPKNIVDFNAYLEKKVKESFD